MARVHENGNQDSEEFCPQASVRQPAVWDGAGGVLPRPIGIRQSVAYDRPPQCSMAKPSSMRTISRV